jgi:predicted  nucleic acid-binding Zn-ribbon protein
MFDLVKSLVKKYTDLHKNMIRAGGELNVSEHNLIRLQDEASDMSNLFMRLEDLKFKHSTLIEEIKTNGEHYKTTGNERRALIQQYRAITDMNMRPAIRRELSVNEERLRNFRRHRSRLWRRARELNKSIKELHKTIIIKTKEFKKTQSKFRDNIRDSEKAVRNIR